MSNDHARLSPWQAGLLAALVPLAFLVGFIVYGAGHYPVPWLLLVVIGVAGAGIPLTVFLFAVSWRK